MSKVNGLSVRLYSHGYDLSGDVSAISAINCQQQLQDVTNLLDSAVERQIGEADGSIAVNAWFNAGVLATPDKLGELQAMTASGHLRTTDVCVMVPFGVTLGDPVAFLTGKVSKHDVNRQPGGAISAAFEAQCSAGLGVEFGIMLTAGKATASSADTGTSVDNGAATTAGASAQLQTFSVATGTYVGVVQDSADNSTFAAITGLTFTGVATAGAPTAERLATAAGATIRRYVRRQTTGTFTNAVHALAFARG